VPHLDFFSPRARAPAGPRDRTSMRVRPCADKMYVKRTLRGCVLDMEDGAVAAAAPCAAALRRHATCCPFGRAGAVTCGPEQPATNATPPAGSARPCGRRRSAACVSVCADRIVAASAVSSAPCPPSPSLAAAAGPPGRRLVLLPRARKPSPAAAAPGAGRSQDVRRVRAHLGTRASRCSCCSATGPRLASPPCAGQWQLSSARSSWLLSTNLSHVANLRSPTRLRFAVQPARCNAGRSQPPPQP
jgi:hypothetical protein